MLAEPVRASSYNAEFWGQLVLLSVPLLLLSVIGAVLFLVRRLLPAPRTVDATIEP